jgi:putative lipoic acid-binding regulatory protein
MDQPPALELLESTHRFPGVYQIKAIGSVSGGFEARVLEAVRSEVAGPSGFVHSVRTTPGGRHVALTLDIPVETAEQVRQIYAKIHALEGLLLLL